MRGALSGDRFPYCPSYHLGRTRLAVDELRGMLMRDPLNEALPSGKDPAHMAFAGIILAAGQSRRAGVFKPAFIHRGKPLLAHAVDGMLPWCERVTVVAGHRHEEAADLVADRERVDVVVNPDPDRGMFSSVQLGVHTVGRGGEGFFVLPADCPLVDKMVYEGMIAAFRGHGGDRAIIPVHGGRGGHPVLLPAAVGDIVLAASPSANLREVLRQVLTERLEVEHSSVLMDLDTPDDLRNLENPSQPTPEA